MSRLCFCFLRNWNRGTAGRKWLNTCDEAMTRRAREGDSEGSDVGGRQARDSAGTYGFGLALPSDVMRRRLLVVPSRCKPTLSSTSVLPEACGKSDAFRHGGGGIVSPRPSSPSAHVTRLAPGFQAPGGGKKKGSASSGAAGICGSSFWAGGAGSFSFVRRGQQAVPG